MTRWIIGVIVVAVAAIGVIVVVASRSDSEPEASAAFGSDADAMAEFRDCLTEHGAEPPEPPSGGELPAPGAEPPSGSEPGAVPPAGGLELNDQTREAMAACSDLMPERSQGFVVPGGAPGFAPTPQN